MTFWAKLLTVLIFVLSILFAAASAILFAKKTEWRQVAEAQRKNFQAQIDEKQRTLDEKLEALRLTTSERDNLRQENTILAERKRGLETEKTTLTASLQEKTTLINTLNTRLEYLQAEAQKADERYNTLRNEKDAVDKELRTTLAKLDDSIKQNKALTEANRALTAELQTTKEKLTAVSETLKIKEELIAHLHKVQPNLRPVIEEVTQLMPRIYGKVLQVHESGIVILNVGAKVGVKIEYKLTVYNKTDFKGVVRIFEVNGDDLSAGRIEYVAKDAQGNPKKIEMGDDVATVLGS